MKSASDLIEINENTFVVGASFGEGIQSVVAGAESMQRTRELFETTTEKGTIDKLVYIKTNSEDNKPLLIKQAIEGNPIVTACIQKRNEIITANGIRYGSIIDQNGNEVFVPQRDNEVINTFFETNNLQNQSLEVTQDLVCLGYAFVELIRNKELTQVVQINHLEAFFSRVTEPDSNKQQYHLYAPDWTSPKKEDITVTPLLNTKSPMLDLMQRTGLLPNEKGVLLDKKEPSFVVMLRPPAFGNIYYGAARWHSIITSGWLDINNNIPKFKAAIMQNEANIQFIIELHPLYMKAIYDDEKITDKQRQEERKKLERERLQKFITGNDKSGRSILTNYQLTNDGKRFEMIKITPVPRSDANTKYELDAQESGAMICMAFGIHPDLLGRIPGLASSNISGTNARELYNIESTLANYQREVMLQPLYMVKKFNKWTPETEFRFMYKQQNLLETGKEITSAA